MSTRNNRPFPNENDRSFKDERHARTRATERRTQHGFMSLTVCVIAFLVILPLGCFCFEVVRSNLAQRELRVATDAAALAAADYVNRAGEPNEALRQQRARNIALAVFRRNSSIGRSLNNAITTEDLSVRMRRDGQTRLKLIFNPDNSVIAQAAIGLRPAFGAFLDLGLFNISAQSKAMVQPLDGDVVIVFDLSKSMGFTTRVEKILRIEDRTTRRDRFGRPLPKQFPRISYQVLENNRSYKDLWAQYHTRTFPNHNALKNVVLTDANPTIPPNADKEYSFLMADPMFMNMQAGQMLNGYAHLGQAQRRALLIESKFTNLEAPGKFDKSGAQRLLQNLGVYGVQARPGFYDDFFRVAIASTHPYFEAKTALETFVDQVGAKNPNLHFGLLGYSRRVPQYQNFERYPVSRKLFLPRLDLDPNARNVENVRNCIEAATLSFGTKTGNAIQRGVEMLNEKHRPGQRKNLILITDGLPNMGQIKYQQAAKFANSSQVRIHAIGFFHVPSLAPRGRKVIRQIVARAGNGSKQYFASDAVQLADALSAIARDGDVALVNQ